MNLLFKSFTVLFISCFIISCTTEGYGEDSPGGDSTPLEVTSIKLSISSENIEVNSEIILTVLSDKNDLLTSSCKFFVNGNEISGNTFKPGEPGEYTVYATYKSLKSNTKTFSASTEPIKNFTSNVLVEDFTGAWCGWCPRVTYKLTELKKTMKTQLIIVAAHYGDAFQYSKISEMTNAFGVSGYPHARINRSVKWNEGEGVDAISSVVSTTSKLGVLIESSISENNLSIKVKAKFSQTYTDLKLGLFLLENDLILDQRNFADLGYGSADPLVDFEHDDVLRVALTSPLGDNIASDATKSGSIFEKTFTYEIPDSYKKDKMHIVAFITDKNRKSLNARESAIGVTQEFEEL
jgi:hypothetical protein|tara:strand:+ start:65 stop:1117 length:1053 start_codon:yes stop_codon:yes gene_type:complete